MKPPRDPIDIWGQLAPSNWMISFKSLTISVICSRCKLLNCLHMGWKGLFQHLKGPPMDGYHEFKGVHKVHIEKWCLYWLFNYVPIFRIFAST